METGAEESLRDALHQMPSVNSIGIRNFADLFIVRTRLPLYGGPGQAWLDGQILNFMPMVQPSFLQEVFRLSPDLRMKARLHYDTIRASKRTLTRFPLNKSGITYPFGLSAVQSWILTRTKSIFVRRYLDAGPDELLLRLKEYILDRMHSVRFQTNPAYNTRAIREAAVDYFDGDLRMRGLLD